MAEKKEFKELVRIMDADIVGTKPLYHALRRVYGVSYTFSNAVCLISGIDRNTKVGELSEDEVKKIEGIIKNPLKNGIPTWLVNRRKDYDSGEDKHLSTSDLKLAKEFDIKRLRKIKCYRGTRHSAGLPVRGQRTKSNFRRNKGKTTGVKKKSAK